MQKTDSGSRRNSVRPFGAGDTNENDIGGQLPEVLEKMKVRPRGEGRSEGSDNAHHRVLYGLAFYSTKTREQSSKAPLKQQSSPFRAVDLALNLQVRLLISPLTRGAKTVAPRTSPDRGTDRHHQSRPLMVRRTQSRGADL